MILRLDPLLLRNTQYAFASFDPTTAGNVMAVKDEYVMLKYVKYEFEATVSGEAVTCW